MNAMQKSRWWVDALLFGGFIVAFLVDLTGLDLHQWLGLGVGALALYHLLEHGDWVAAVLTRFLGKATNRSRLFLVIDAALGAGFVGILFTGLVISSWFNLAISNSQAWLAAHILISILTLLLTVAKIALHGRWVGGVARSIFSRQSGPAAGAQPAAGVQPAAEVLPARLAPVGRREFVRVMGVVGLGTLAALSQSMPGLLSVTASSDSQAGTVSGTNASSGAGANPGAGASSTTGSSSTTACQLRCGKRCSYPGHCRRYSDSNHNGRCDLGECAS